MQNLLACIKSTAYSKIDCLPVLYCLYCTVKSFIVECIVTSKLDHPNVLSLIGVSINPEDGTLHMIMPFMHHGDVKSFLKKKRGNIIELDHFPKVAAYVLYIYYLHMYMNAFIIFA